ncbi:alpha-galactosidase 1 [Citrus sinensis]|uniref:Alpha-galactosidase 1 n=1 Tax=Citrus sinensis TaxID=2711 RepID=A0ACB8NBT3_CITSI|nr:alpha-galactosidase 1 [Citrus sinensis]
MLQAPLLLGCDVGNLTAETMPIIGNEEVIAVNQDPLGVQAKKVRMQGERMIWAGPLSGNRIVVLLESRKTFSSMMTAHWDDIGIKSNNTLFEHRTLETKFQGKLTAKVDGHSCKMYELTPVTKL